MLLPRFTNIFGCGGSLIKNYFKTSDNGVMHFLKNDIVMYALEWMVINQLITKPPHCRLKSRRELAALEGVFILASIYTQNFILVRFVVELNGIIEFYSV